MRTKGGHMRIASLMLAVGLLPVVWPEPTWAQERRWLPDPVESAVFVDVDGDLFGDPLQIRGSPGGGFVVADWADFAIRAFSVTGDRLWRFGRSGGGPGEFLRFDDVEYDRDGQLLILDNENLRVTVLDSNGSLVGSLRLPNDAMREVMPSSFSPGDRVVTPRDRGEALWMAISSAGRVSATGPAVPFTFQEPIEGESWATPLPNGGAAIAFRWSSQMILLGPGGGVRMTVEGVEPIPFAKAVHQSPDVEIPGFTIIRITRMDRETAIPAVRSVTADNSRILVLFSGSTEDAGRILDTYAVSDGSYLGSFRLPDRAYRDVTMLADGRLATLDTELYPVVRLWSVR